MYAIFCIIPIFLIKHDFFYKFLDFEKLSQKNLFSSSSVFEEKSERNGSRPFIKI